MYKKFAYKIKAPHELEAIIGPRPRSKKALGEHFERSVV